MPNNESRIVVIGAQAAGLGAATAAKKINRLASVTVLERSIYASSSPCGLPYFIGGEIEDEKVLTFAEPHVIRDKMGIDLRMRHEAVAIHPDHKIVDSVDLEHNREYELGYDALIIAAGASPKKPPLDGIDAPNVFTLRTIGDALAIKSHIEQHHPSKAVVVGAGYIGIEMVEAFVRLGLEVTLVEMLPNILPNMDSDMSSPVAEVLADQGVEVMTAAPLDRITCDSRGFASSIRAGDKEFGADIVLLALGVRPRVELAQKAGISLGAQGAISADERQETSIKDIYAAGDCCQAKDIVSGRETYTPLATAAEKQGKVAGENAAGADLRFAGILGTGISSAFGLAFSSTGLSAETAKQLGINAASQSFVGHSHAAYYPNPRPLKLKVVFDPKTGRLLGAQAVGEEGVLARMNAFIAAIHAGLTVKDLAQLDLPYAPQFGSSWDPIHVVAMMAQRRVK